MSRAGPSSTLCDAVASSCASCWFASVRRRRSRRRRAWRCSIPARSAPAWPGCNERAAMSLPPFVLAAALAFWGWRSGHYGAAAVLALLAEGPRYFRARFELQHGDFARVADLCSVLFVALIGWLFLSLRSEERRV